ncbi:MAG TPA: hypothetical protein VL738_11625 [Dactylosporangium sp.]|nr:hypothetical protein [Dactylosporangium sp.]
MSQRPLHFAAFVMNTTGHIIQGTWRRPTARQADFNRLDLWVDLARTLRERGLARREYPEGTLRQKLFGRGDRLPATHPAARYRGAFTAVSA